MPYNRINDGRRYANRGCTYRLALRGSVDQPLTECLPVIVGWSLVDNNLLVVVWQLVDDVLVLLRKLQLIVLRDTLLRDGSSVWTMFSQPEKRDLRYWRRCAGSIDRVDKVDRTRCRRTQTETKCRALVSRYFPAVTTSWPTIVLEQRATGSTIAGGGGWLRGNVNEGRCPETDNGPAARGSKRALTVLGFQNLNLCGRNFGRAAR